MPVQSYAAVSNPYQRAVDGDAALLAAALAGDAQAVAAVYDRHAGPLYYLATCLLGSSSAAEPVVVDVVVQACTVPGAVILGSGSLRTALVRLTYRSVDPALVAHPTREQPWSDPARLEQTPDDVLGETAEAEGRAAAVLEQAKGVLNYSGDLGMPDAFAALRHYARDHGLKITDLAHALVHRALHASVVLEHARTRDA